jgi:hypothetical protein
MVFSQNYNFIKEHNKLYESGLVSYALAVNEFADVTPDEFLKTYATLHTPIQHEKHEHVRHR